MGPRAGEGTGASGEAPGVSGDGPGASADGVLVGRRVLELGSGVSAAFCARLLADYGADVLKVESREGGDETRRWGPFPGDRPDPEASGSFVFLNTGKRSATLSPDHAGDRARLAALLAEADLFVVNECPAGLRAWDLDPATLAERFPRLVTIALTPFGLSGPYADWNAHDLNAYHLTACGSRYCGRPGEPPLEQGTFSTEFFGGFAGAAWGLAALLGRERAGGGQLLDVACAEVVAALFVGAQNIGAFAQDGRYEKRSGRGMSLAAPATILPCADGHVWIIALETAQWHGLRRAMGDPEWARVELFDDMFERGRNADVLYPLIEAWTRQHSKHEIMARCQAEGCPATAVFTTADLGGSEHLWQRGALVRRDQPGLGRHAALAPPVRLGDGLPRSPRPAPSLGAHDAIWKPRGEPDRPRASSTRSGGASVPPTRRERDADARHLPLAGLRVVNFGWAWAGPAAGQVLGLLGAEVYKVETRARIDINRTLPPFAGGQADPDRSLQNHAGWAGNGSVRLNLRKPEARELARRLVALSDVAIENFGPGVMAKLELGWERLRAVRPDLVFVSMPGAGLTGPLSHLRTYGNSLGGISGIDQITGYAGEGPMPMENAFADPYCGVAAAFAALLALEQRRRTGRGQHVDCSQQECLMQLVGPHFADWALNGRVAGPIGNRHPLGAAVPHGVFPCRGEDRWISLVVEDDEGWRALVRELGTPDWTRGLDTLAKRRERIDAIHAHLAIWTADHDDRALALRLQRAGIAAAPVLDVSDLLSDPHYRARGTFIEVTHPLGFRETIYGAYVKASRSRVEVRPGPTIGQDDEVVFRELLGLSTRRLQELIEQEVVY